MDLDLPLHFYVFQNMTTDDRTLAELTQDIIAGHQRLQGVSASVAELQYIIEVQQLEGYGLEYYPAKVSIGICQLYLIPHY